jgi:P27 family predicted phage terminase small subunit
MGLRGPAPKSRDRKILEGTFRKDRDTGPTLSPPPLTKAPSPPGWLSDAGRKEWRRVARELMAQNALTAVDLRALEGYCASYARAVKAEEVIGHHGLTHLTPQGEKARPEVAIARQSWAEMRAFSTKLGINPADHTRVKVRERKPDATVDPWAGVANG